MQRRNQERRTSTREWVGAGLRTLLLVPIAMLPAYACLDCEDFCDDAVDINFEPATAWPDGTYEVDLKFDKKEVHCTVRLGWTEPCDDDRTIANTEWVSHLGTPKRVDVTVSFEGRVLGSSTFEPRYEKISDWDRACGPPCRTADVTQHFP
jgi:hypothetical protein